MYSRYWRNRSPLRSFLIGVLCQSSWQPTDIGSGTLHTELLRTFQSAWLRAISRRSPKLDCLWLTARGVAGTTSVRTNSGMFERTADSPERRKIRLTLQARERSRHRCSANDGVGA